MTQRAEFLSAAVRRPFEMGRARVGTVVGRLIIDYFDLAYRLLLGSEAGQRFLVRAAPPDAPLAHSYLTAADMDVLVSTLRLSAGDLVLDLGCGFGEVAIAVHKRTGADVLGIETSSHALAEARRRIAANGVERHVRVAAGDIGGPRVSDGSRAVGAYGIDSLMFLPGHWSVFGSLLRQMAPGGRVFATMLEFGPSEPGRIERRLSESDVSVETIEDVSDELRSVSELRRRTALGLLRSGGSGHRGRLAMLAVAAEESLIGSLLSRGLVRRWRISARAAGPRHR